MTFRTENEVRQHVVNTAASYIGCKENDGSFRPIIDLYNSYTPRARGYKLSYTDPWCAGFVSAVSIACEVTDILPLEVSCDMMISKFQDLDCWMEDDSYVPKPGDILFYDWDDNGYGDNIGGSDHVGIIESVNGSTMTVIEGNMSDAVGRRSIGVNARYIRGYGVPKYSSKISNVIVSSQPVVSTKTREQEIWDFLWDKLRNACGVAGLMGNLFAESGLSTNNLENYRERELGKDSEYTEAVNNGSYTNFVYDNAGYGLAQWTYSSRKKQLLDNAKKYGKSIDDLSLQLDYLWWELQNLFPKVLAVLLTASSVREASDIVLKDFENPSDKGETVQRRRAEYGEKYYTKYKSRHVTSCIALNGDVKVQTSTISTPTKPSVSSIDVQVGETVYFAGGKHYLGTGSTNGSDARECLAKVTAISANGRHPVHLRAVNDNGKFISGFVYGWVDIDSFSKLVDKSKAPAPSTPDNWIPKVNDIVRFCGERHYVSSTSGRSYPCTRGLAKITGYVPNTEHPYHIIHQDDSSNVYGWVSLSDLAKP